MPTGSNQYDVIIVGAGLFGLSAAYALTKEGKSVLVLDQSPTVGQGASYGSARMSKRDPRNRAFDPFVIASQKEIRALEQDQPHSILSPTDCFDLCPPGHPLIAIYQDSLAEGKCTDPFARFGITPKAGYEVHGYDKEQTYTVNPEALLAKLKAACQAKGCTFQLNTPITSWESKEASATITTEDGTTLSADHVLLAANGWTPKLLEKGNVPVHRTLRYLEEEEEQPHNKIVTKRAPIWNFAFPKEWTEAQKMTIGRSSIPKQTYLDVYYLPEKVNDEWRMKVGLNSDRDRNGHYASPDEILHHPDPTISTITEAETAKVKLLMQENFGITLEDPLSQHICYMTYTMPVSKEAFAVPFCGPVLDEKGTPLANVSMACGGCGILAKLCPAIGEVAAKGINSCWQDPACTAFSTARYIPTSSQVLDPITKAVIGRITTV